MSNDKNDVIFKQLTAQIEEYNSNLIQAKNIIYDYRYGML